MNLLASIPSPSFNSIGPLNIYGLCIALGVIAAVWLFGKRLAERGFGTPDDASSIAIWAVLAGVIGARLYHVVTDWEKFEGNYGDIPKLWEGGLGIPGGLLFGIPVGLWMARSKGIPLSVAATCAAPAIPLAQAIGRWGNYFNQELYGRPTDLPWALEIDAEHLVAGYEVGTTFHPTFLYESLWSLGVVAVLLLVDKRTKTGPGALMGLYLAAYGLGRFWVEGLRIDPADEIAGLRLNQWVALAAVVGGAGIFLALRNRPWPAPTRALDEFGDDSLEDDSLEDDSLVKPADPDGSDDAGEPDDADDLGADETADAEVDGDPEAADDDATPVHGSRAGSVDRDE